VFHNRALIVRPHSFRISVNDNDANPFSKRPTTREGGEGTLSSLSPREPGNKFGRCVESPRHGQIRRSAKYVGTKTITQASRRRVGRQVRRSSVAYRLRERVGT